MNLNKELKRIKAKIILELPLTEKEKALWILYGERNEVKKLKEQV